MRRRRIYINKATVYSIVINAIQIIAIIGIAVLVLLTDIEKTSPLLVEFIVCIAAGFVIWGAVVDIQQAVSARHIVQQADMLEEAYGQLEGLNVTLRAQRHDFMNHLQVVGGLIEMSEHEEAAKYIERVYGDILSVSSAVRTMNAAVNALLRVKMGESQKRGIFMDLHIQASWESLAMPAWEMCRILSNLIDNSMDALSGTSEPRITITLSENAEQCAFCIENNGPPIRKSMQETIFRSGVTTKGNGRGMGLAIVKQVVESHGGDISFTSGAEKTSFCGWIPAKSPIAPLPKAENMAQEEENAANCVQENMIS